MEMSIGKFLQIRNAQDGSIGPTFTLRHQGGFTTESWQHQIKQGCFSWVLDGIILLECPIGGVALLSAVSMSLQLMSFQR